MRILGLGRMGVGKSTLGRALASRLLVPHVSVGNALRRSIASGELSLDDATPARMLQLLEMIAMDAAGRLTEFILDGYPRTVAQAYDSDKIFAFSHVLYLTLNDDVRTSRIMKRGRRSDTEDRIRFRNQIEAEEIERVWHFLRRQSQSLHLDASLTVTDLVAKAMAELALRPVNPFSASRT